MKEHPFYLDNEENLIMVPCLLDSEKITLALDTGASHTVIDLTKLLLVGYQLSEAISTTQFATASGVVNGYIFQVKSLQALGLRRESPLISSYDMLGNDFNTDFDGMLGLDFLRDTDLMISFRRFVLGLDW